MYDFSNEQENPEHISVKPNMRQSYLVGQTPATNFTVSFVLLGKDTFLHPPKNIFSIKEIFKVGLDVVWKDGKDEG
jgi:hypothetical protein